MRVRDVRIGAVVEGQIDGGHWVTVIRNLPKDGQAISGVRFLLQRATCLVSQVLQDLHRRTFRRNSPY
ncbi:hypothetical protein [Ktedonospora formicarum]|uniref:hypothetical protein n=1 Tax=Ktedonospora formicarum TaxID=2778364 RepID=UPI001C689B0E|nr:hypothetical protein [Ktedonospora formicarum]